MGFLVTFCSSALYYYLKENYLVFTQTTFIVTQWEKDQWLYSFFNCNVVVFSFLVSAFILSLFSMNSKLTSFLNRMLKIWRIFFLLVCCLLFKKKRNIHRFDFHITFSHCFTRQKKKYQYITMLSDDVIKRGRTKILFRFDYIPLLLKLFFFLPQNCSKN